MASSRAAYPRKPDGEPKRSSVALMLLGVGCIVSGFAFKNCTKAEMGGATEKERLRRSSSANSSSQITPRSSRRNPQNSKKTPALPSHLKYIANANRQLTVSDIQHITTEITQAFPKNFESAAMSLEQLRQFRNAQIELVVTSFSHALTLTSSQSQEMENQLTNMADSHFEKFAEKHHLSEPNSGFKHQGRKYHPISASEMMALCQPLQWLNGCKLHELCELTEAQSKVLIPSNSGISSGFYGVPTGRYDIAPRMRNPVTGTISGFAKGSIPDFPIAGNLLPLTPNQGFLLQELMEKKKANEPNLLKQSLILSREQLTLSLLLRPKTTLLLEKELNLKSP